MVEQKLGKKIKELLLQHDLEYKDISTLFGFEQESQVSRWANGKLYPSIEQIMVLSKKLKYNLFNELADPKDDYKERYFTLLEELHKMRANSETPQSLDQSNQEKKRPRTFGKRPYPSKSVAPDLPGDKDNIHVKGSKSKE